MKVENPGLDAVAEGGFFNRMEKKILLATPGKNNPVVAMFNHRKDLSTQLYASFCRSLLDVCSTGSVFSLIPSQGNSKFSGFSRGQRRQTKVPYQNVRHTFGQRCKGITATVPFPSCCRFTLLVPTPQTRPICSVLY